MFIMMTGPNQEVDVAFHAGWSTTRRRVLKNFTLAGLASLAPVRPLLAMKETGTTAAPAADGKPVVKDRPPLMAGTFYLLPLGSIKPRGWLRQQLAIQASGLSGHLGETWPDVGPNSGWLGGTGESWERGPYYLDGLIPLAYLLDDARLKSTAQKFIEWTLTHQAADGMIGPASNNDWWPRIVMLKALTQYQEVSGDPRVIPLMDKYFRHQLAALPGRPLRTWAKFRWQDNLLSVIWLYNRTGSAYLLDLAQILHRQGHDWMAEYAHFQYTFPITRKFLNLYPGNKNGLKDKALSTHGVNNGQAIKTGPVWSLVSRSAADRGAVLTMISELDKYHGLPNGMFSCDEHLAGLDPVHGSELCTVVEYMFSLERSLAIVGDAALGDRLEKLAFNALPGAITDDMWAHQYDQEPNQVECSRHHKPWVTDGPESNLYGLAPNFGCCTANFNQGWPKFAASLFLLSGAQGTDTQDGLVAAVYAPCEVNTIIRGTPVHVTETTDYPFREKVQMVLNPASPLQFPLQLRIPAWAEGTKITVNGRPVPASAPGSFARIERTWKAGDQIEVVFPMKPRISRWFHNSIAVERGPLVFSYGIGESWVKLRNRGMTADWQVFPATQWNYALDIDEASPEKSITVAETEMQEGPFTRRHAPVRLEAKARLVNKWRATDGATDVLPESPVASSEPERTIALIPYAAAKLRITAFPEWKRQI